MAQHKSLNGKLSDSQLIKLKAGLKSTEVTLKLPSNIVVDLMMRYCYQLINKFQSF